MTEGMSARSTGGYTAASLISTAACRHGAREALVCSGTGRRYTYVELNARANRLAHALMDRGFRKGDVVGVLCSNRAELVEAYFACAKAGFIGLPLNYRLAAAEIATLLAAVGASALVCEARFGEVLPAVREATSTLRAVLWIGETPPAGTEAYEPALGRASSAAPAVEILEDDPFYFNLTSGTTGLPKAYLVSHYAAASVVVGFVSWQLAWDDVLLVTFPAFGRVGFGWISSGLAFGLRIVLADFQPEHVLRVIAAERVTFTMLVPTMAAMLLRSAELAEHDRSSLRCIAYAGAPLPAPIREQSLASLCPALAEGYGLQECGWLAISLPADRARKPDSVGVPPLFAEVRIVDAEGRPVPAGALGEIVARTVAGTTAYYASPERTAEAFRDGWFHTGDLGRFDEDGFLYVSGRVKDMIITGGQNVHSAEVEATLLGMPGVRDCAVIGVPDPTWGERVVAVVVPDGSRAVSLEALQAHCRARIAGFKIPRELHLQDNPLPRTPTGKVQKFLLVGRYAATAT